MPFFFALKKYQIWSPSPRVQDSLGGMLGNHYF